MRWRIPFETMISFALMALFQLIKLQQQSLMIIRPLNVLQISLLYFLQSCMLCILLLIGWIWQMMVKKFHNFLRFKVCTSDHFGPRLDTSSCPQGTGTPSLASTVPGEEYKFTGFQVMLVLGLMKRRMPLLKLAFREKFHIFPFPVVILKNTSMSF